MDKTQKAILIDLIHPKMLKRHAMERMVELEELVNTYGGIVIVKAWQKRFAPHPKTYIGTGKVTLVGEEAKQLGAKLLIVNAQLKPRQVYDLSERLRPYGVQVWDRVDLILKIFAKHAKTTEAKLEIELASVRHMGPRIFGMGMELSRQGGGIGTVGIGETNIERMKRHLREKERKIKEKLEGYQNGRDLARRHRSRQGFKTVSIVGYTNAGKTTLLNALTGRKEYAADELFATLDTRVGQLFLPGINFVRSDTIDRPRTALVSDTIGFIKDLPPELLNAFSSTLSEAVDADLLIHVVDGSDPNWLKQMKVVDEILERLGVASTPRIVVFNKNDQTSSEARVSIDKTHEEHPPLWISATKHQGLDDLIAQIENSLSIRLFS
ncbi:GTPase HflX [Candidatus Uhrbacteria bacterium]|nr:GTPase HflX [Candidatus Uhrbacteria bacterium]